MNLHISGFLEQFFFIFDFTCDLGFYFPLVLIFSRDKKRLQLIQLVEGARMENSTFPQAQPACTHSIHLFCFVDA